MFSIIKKKLEEQKEKTSYLKTSMSDTLHELRMLFYLDTQTKRNIFYTILTIIIFIMTTPIGYFLSDFGKKYIIQKPDSLLLQIIKIIKDAPLVFFIMILTAILISSIIAKREIKKSENSDTRNLPIDYSKPIDGSARWLNRKEQKESFNLVDMNNYTAKDDGIPIAKNKRGEYLCIPWDSKGKNDLSNRNIMLYGPPGSRKTTSIILPTVIANLLAGNGILVTDPKGEVYKKTVPLAIREGYDIKVFNVKGDEFENTCGIDILKFIKESTSPVEDAMTFANIIMDNTTLGMQANQFWYSGEFNILTFFLLYVAKSEDFKPYFLDTEGKKVTDNLNTSEINAYRTIDSFYKLLTSLDTASIEKIIKDLKDDDIAKTSGLIWSRNDQRSQIISNLPVRLRILQSPMIKKILSRDEINFKDMAKEKTICYVINSDQTQTFKFLISLFTSFAFIELTRLADSQNSQKLEKPFYFIFEELYSVGRIPDFAVKLSTLRSRNINIFICLQSLTQLKSVFSGNVDGKDEWEIIQTCCSTQVCLGAGDETTQDFFRTTLGPCTLKVSQKRKDMSVFNFLKFTPDFSETLNSKKRDLMTNDELYRLMKSQIIITSQTIGNILLDKCYYLDMPEAHLKLLNKDKKEVTLTVNQVYPVWRQEEEYENYISTATEQPNLDKSKLVTRFESTDLNALNQPIVYTTVEKPKYSFKKKFTDIIMHIKDIENEELEDTEKDMRNAKGYESSSKSSNYLTQEDKDTYNDINLPNQDDNTVDSQEGNTSKNINKKIDTETGEILDNNNVDKLNNNNKEDISNDDELNDNNEEDTSSDDDGLNDNNEEDLLFFNNTHKPDFENFRNISEDDSSFN